MAYQFNVLFLVLTVFYNDVFGASETNVNLLEAADALLNAVTAPLSVDQILANLPDLSTPSALGPCGGFKDVKVPFSKFVGTFYTFRAKFEGGQATYACASVTYSPSVAGSANLDSYLTRYSIDRSNYETIHRLWVTTSNGVTVNINENDPTQINVVSRVAYIENVGFATALCPIGVCNNGAYDLRVHLKNRNANSTDVDRLVAQALNSFVPTFNLVPIQQNNCSNVSTAFTHT